MNKDESDDDDDDVLEDEIDGVTIGKYSMRTSTSHVRKSSIFLSSFGSSSPPTKPIPPLLPPHPPPPLPLPQKRRLHRLAAVLNGPKEQHRHRCRRQPPRSPLRKRRERK